MNYVNDMEKLLKMFPATFLCAVGALLFTFDPSLIPTTMLKNYFFNENIGWNMWVPVLIPFTYQIVRLFFKQIKAKIRFTSRGKKSWKTVLDEIHTPAFFLTESVSLIAILIELLIQVGYGIPKPEYSHVHIFEVFFSAFVMPYIAWVNYYCKVLRDQSIPNSTINH